MSKYLFKTSAEYVKFLKNADENYYQSDSPKISDKMYDDVKTEFQTRFPEDEYNKSVGALAKSSLFSKVSHKIKMGSQEKINTPEDLSSWEKSINSKISDYSLFISEKIDGLSLSLTYNHGKLILGSTRGDGITGEDVTQNVLKITSIPKSIKEKKEVTIRGEVVILLKDFEKNFKDKANPRNAAAGSLRRLDGERCEHLSFFAYDIIVEGKSLKTEKEKFTYIQDLGFNCPAHFSDKKFNDVNKVWEDYVNKLRKNLSYEIDGLVLSINEVNFQDELGIINNRPRFSRAYKFPSQRDQTRIKSVSWFAGRTGKITPVAEVDPVNLSGAIITNVTLHNLAEMERLGVKLNSLVEIVRAGDVIPKIERVLDNADTVGIEIPEKCPACFEKTDKTSTFLICNNSDCSAKRYETLLFWVKSLDIKGFGDKLVENLIGSGLVKEPADYYKLTVDQLMDLDRMGEKSASKVLKELNSKKEISLPKFIQGLGIPTFSEKRAEQMMEKFSTIEEFQNAKLAEIVLIKGFEEKSAQAIVNGLKNKKEVIKNLLKHISIKKNKPPSKALLKGQSFCFTGVRDKVLEEKIKDLSGKISSGVSSDLSFLVCKDPDDSSSKIKKAKSLDIKIISLEEAWSLVNK